jgi:four helix bundle protein
MGPLSTFRNLDVWQLAMEVVVASYTVAERFPRHELYGLGQQVRRSAVSIPSNVAEGHNRHATRAYLNHVNIALGSQAELETQVEVAIRLRYVTPSDVSGLLDDLTRVGQMLHGLQRKLEATRNRHLAMLSVFGVAVIALLMR